MEEILLQLKQKLLSIDRAEARRILNSLDSEYSANQIELEAKNHEIEVSKQQISECNKRYQLLFDNAPIPYQSLNNAGCFLDINTTWLKALGYNRLEVIGQWFGAFLHPSSLPSFELHFPEFLKHGFINDVEFQIKHKNGHYLDVLFKGCVSHNPKGEIERTYCTFQDITERKKREEQRLKLEQELRQKHKMEAIGYMAGGMAHNFNNNLSIILGNVELSQMKQAPGSEVIPLLENAKIAVRRSRDLVLKIITYSRKGITHKAPTHLTEILDETYALFDSILPTTVALQRNCSADCENKLINADASQVQEVLINLCNNAVQAMDDKGELKISLNLVDLEEKNIPAQFDCLPGRYAKLSVRDSGCGMPSEMLDNIFDPFYSTKEEYEGAGMGLSTVQGIVAQHDGMIKVNSVLNQGTTFDLYFPLIELSENVEPEAAKTPLSKGTERILFVDDDEKLATLGEQLLSTLGYQVSMMTDSTETLKMFTANTDRFDLVITDQTMPGLTGKDLIAEIKKVRADIPTILCTGYSNKIDEDKATNLGINAFMMKPLDLPQLSQTIRRVLDGDKEI